MISNHFLGQKTILAQILSYMDYKYSIYSTPHFGGFKRNLLNSNQILQIFEIRKCLKNRQKKTDEARIWRNSLSKYLTKVYSFQKSLVFSTQKSSKLVRDKFSFQNYQKLFKIISKFAVFSKPLSVQKDCFC